MSFSFFSMTGCSSIKTDIPNADISSECLTEANFLAVAELPQRMVGNPSDPNSIPGVFRLDGWDIRYVRTFTRNRITFAKTGTNYTLGFVSNEGGELKITPLAVWAEANQKIQNELLAVFCRAGKIRLPQ